MLFPNFAYNDLGKENIWVDQIQVPISDVHKTIIDMLENPKCGAGIQHSIDCLKVYFDEHYNEKIFISYIKEVKNKVFFKRLGYITEILFGVNHPLCKLSKNYITKGDSLIDSSINCNKLITRWHLYISDGIAI
jgi:predicted transcriptional regulator of viral defense system